MALATVVLAVLVGYVLGSVPSAYLIGRLKGVSVGEDCGIGTTAAVRSLGLPLGAVVGAMDFAKGALAVMAAQTLGVPQPAVLLAGLAAVTGHNWSVFLGFRGGWGAMTSYGVLSSLVPVQFLIALAFGGVVYYLTRRSTLATFLLLTTLSAMLWAGTAFNLTAVPAQREVSVLLIVFPLSLFVPMMLKPAVSKCA